MLVKVPSKVYLKMCMEGSVKLHVKASVHACMQVWMDLTNNPYWTFLMRFLAAPQHTAVMNILR
jgi:hypothetical protein